MQYHPNYPSWLLCQSRGHSSSHVKAKVYRDLRDSHSLLQERKLSSVPDPPNPSTTSLCSFHFHAVTSPDIPVHPSSFFHPLSSYSIPLTHCLARSTVSSTERIQPPRTITCQSELYPSLSLIAAFAPPQTPTLNQGIEAFNPDFTQKVNNPIAKCRFSPVRPRPWIVSSIPLLKFWILASWKTPSTYNHPYTLRRFCSLTGSAFS